jgi:hypothetical protein
MENTHFDLLTRARWAHIYILAVGPAMGVLGRECQAEATHVAVSDTKRTLNKKHDINGIDKGRRRESQDYVSHRPPATPAGDELDPKAESHVRHSTSISRNRITCTRVTPNGCPDLRAA